MGIPVRLVCRICSPPELLEHYGREAFVRDVLRYAIRTGSVVQGAILEMRGIHDCTAMLNDIDALGKIDRDARHA